MDGRRKNGGKRIGAGRKSKADELGLVALLDECFSKDHRVECVQRLAEDCQSDDFHERHESRKLLLAYTFGKPKEKHEHEGGDNPIEIIVRHVKRSPPNAC